MEAQLHAFLISTLDVGVSFTSRSLYPGAMNTQRKEGSEGHTNAVKTNLWYLSLKSNPDSSVD
jgi:hypothetical protein